MLERRDFYEDYTDLELDRFLLNLFIYGSFRRIGLRMVRSFSI